MPIDTQTAGTPGWWLNRLITRLGDRQEHYNKGEAYYLGDAPLPRGAHEARAAYQRLLRMSRLNMGELVVEATRERMKIIGFRTSDEINDRAWEIWQANSLDADQGLVDTPCLSMGDAYVIVGPTDPDIGAPVITPEDPRQVITEHDPVRRRKVTAALKVFHDEITGMDKAYLYLPAPQPGAGATVLHAVRPAQADGFRYTPGGFEWQTRSTLPVDQVPVVRFANRARNYQLPGRSELDGAFDTLDRINHMVLERVVIATVQAYRQRAVKGNLPRTDANGNEIDYTQLFAPDPGAMWNIPADVDIWESQPIDLTPILKAGKDDIENLAGTTRTPLYYLSPDTADGSAEGASLAREGLVFKVGDRNVQADESWEQAMALAFRFDNRPGVTDAEVVRQPPDRFSLSERYDAAVKARAAGVPDETVWTDVLQFSPQQVARMQAQKATEALLAPPPDPVDPVTPEPV